MDIIKIALLLGFIGFLTVWLASGINIEKPASFNVFEGFSSERESPGDWISENQIHVYNDRIVIDLEGALWSRFTDTNSMDPLFDKGSNGIEIIPDSADDIEIGDIISYRSEYSDGVIIHRVIDKGEDSEGVYFIVKGDNNPAADPGKIRFGQIESVLVGILY
ncbi:signal peptidase I [Candidatus Woesearchaeota archaeon]|nr:signal peptidase I [Candidatus Woesearchaeota archaeon]